MNTMLIWAFVLAGIVMLFGLMNGSSEKAGETRRLTGFEPIEDVKMKSEKGREVFNKLKDIYKSGEDKTVMNYKNIIDTVTDPTDFDYIEALYTELLSRFVPVGGTKGLQLHTNEKSFFSEINCAVYTIQKLNKQISYGGLRSNINGYRTGTFSVNAYDVEGYKLSFQGKLFVTNQRIAIVGDNKNKVIPLGKIISYAPYEKNGIIINVENSNAIILDMLTNGTFTKLNTGERVFCDAKIRFLYALDEALGVKEKVV